ncbi:MAG: STAS domain-containing protein [Victivallaceae bacterium]|nr:STAS domain-containing protein [Victivallaceae bacterium]
MSDGKILYSKSEEKYFIKLTGNLRFTSGHDFNSLLDVIFKDPDVRDIMIDMSEADYLDSTILGLLAKTANFMIKKFQRKAMLLSTNEDINYLLESISLNNVFILVKTCDCSSDMLKNIPNIKSSEQEKALTILNAHRELVKLNEKNRSVFKDVIELLEKEVK